MRPLDNFAAIRRLDPSGMLAKAATLPDQCLQGWRLGCSWKVPARLKRLDQLLVLGVGGSAIGGDLIQGFLAEGASKPVLVQRNYTLPAWVNRRTLALVVSYSGNTEETLTAAFQAKRRGAQILAVTSGGKLARWAVRNRFPLVRIPGGWPPRAAMGYGAFVPLGLMDRLGWFGRKDPFPVRQAAQEATRYILKKLAPEVPESRNPAKQLASRLQGGLPLLYGASGGWEGVVYRWRTQLEENAKTLAYHHLFPEATHNEISGWGEPRACMKEIRVLLMTDPAVHPRIRRRMDFTARVARQEGARIIPVEVPGRSRLARMLKLISLGDFVSVYLGLLYRVDPTPVVRVEALKRFMRGLS